MMLHRNRVVTFAVLALTIARWGGFATAQSTARPDAKQAGLDEERLAEIPVRMQAFVKRGEIAGAVTLVARNGRIAGLEAVGWADLENKTPMQVDTLFRIASMTKPITATAILMLQQEGKLSIHDPVAKHLPEFEKMWLVHQRSDDTVTLRRPSRSITIRDLLTHTSGLNRLPRKGLGLQRTLSEVAGMVSQKPLLFEPGSKWQYSNDGMITLGRIIEVVSGQEYAAFLRERIFLQLGMHDTMFFPTDSKAARVAKLYRPDRERSGKLALVKRPFVSRGRASQRRIPNPAGGLYSTAKDMARFYQMVLNGGQLDGKRILSEPSIQLMTRLHTGTLTCGFTPGMGFGLGWGVVREPSGATSMLSLGTYGHGGAYGTQGWVDPAKQMIFVLMIQRTGFGNADASEIRRAFQDIAVSAIR